MCARQGWKGTTQDRQRLRRMPQTQKVNSLTSKFKLNYTFLKRYVLCHKTSHFHAKI